MRRLTWTSHYMTLHDFYYYNYLGFLYSFYSVTCINYSVLHKFIEESNIRANAVSDNTFKKLTKILST